MITLPRNANNKFRNFASLWLILALCLGLFSFIAIPPVTAAPIVKQSAANRQLLIQLYAGVDLSAINQNYGTVVVRKLKEDNTYLLQVPPGIPVSTILSLLQQDPRLVYAEINSLTSIIEGQQIFILFDGNSALQNGGGTSSALAQASTQWAFQRINLAPAQLLSRGSGVTMALLDSGVNSYHPDLVTHLVSGYNSINQSYDTSDCLGHGTFVAGLLAMVAPAAKILPVKVLGSDGYGTVADLADGLYYASDHGAQVINISLGTSTPSKTLDRAVRYAQRTSLLVASAGNQNSTTPRYPAASQGVISVAATDSNNQKASFSNYGPTITVSAPGVDLYSTYWSGGYAYGSGTSFATPLVAGEAALILSKNSLMKGPQVFNQITSTATSLLGIDLLYGSGLGKGLINVLQGVATLKLPLSL